MSDPGDTTEQPDPPGTIPLDEEQPHPAPEPEEDEEQRENAETSLDQPSEG